MAGSGLDGTAEPVLAPNPTGLRRIPPRYRTFGAVAIFAVVAGVTALSGSHSSSKISQADIDKLNSAAVQIRAAGDAMTTRLSNCLTASHPVACTSAVLDKANASLMSGAATYAQVAADTKGDCRSALNAAAASLRVFAKTGKSPAGGFARIQDNVGSGCHLKAKPTA